MKSLQKESEWEKEFVRRFPNTYYIGAEEVGGDFTKHTTFSREYFKDFVLYAVSNRENEIAEEVSNALHEYARWILTDGKDAGPLQRRGKKKEITLQLLKH